MRIESRIQKNYFELKNQISTLTCCIVKDVIGNVSLENIFLSSFSSDQLKENIVLVLIKLSSIPDGLKR